MHGMLDPLVSLAFGVHSSPGVFALLLGSGVSRAAQIPTGWNIVDDLVRKIAKLEGVSPEPADPVAWYRTTHGREPSYSDLLLTVAPSLTERQSLLKGYFEPSSIDFQNGRKLPTDAHKAIARLVKSGHVRVIITTNFDRLLEAALDGVGVQPVVISTPDGIQGAPPLQHSSCTIVKVNGDYRDTRIRNTDQELATYPPEICELLDRVFDDYGLIVCGWSSEWDAALRDALSRRRNRRYPCYWCVKDPLPTRGQELSTLVSAVTAPISDANTFFESLAENVSALDHMSRPHPLSTPLAVELLKEYIPEDKHRIRLRELVVGAATKTRDDVLALGPPDPPNSHEEMRRCLSHYETLAERIVALLANGIFWDAPEGPYNKLWPDVLGILAKPVLQANRGNDGSLRLFRYPACLALYAAGVAACASDRLGVLADLLKVEAQTGGEKAIPVYKRIWPNSLLDPETERFLDGPPWALHQRIFQYLGPVFLRLVPDEERFRFAYYKFEYLLALRALAMDDGGLGGLFISDGEQEGRRDILPVMSTELQEQRTDWAPMAAGVLPKFEFDWIANLQSDLHKEVQRRRSRLDFD